MTDTDPMIKLEGVSKVYQTRQRQVRALDKLSLEIPAGQFAAVRGPSGCGKSTLLSLVGGLALPTEGRVMVAGQEISAMSPAERARFRADTLGFVFQLFHLLPYLSVLDNVLLAAEDRKGHEARRQAESLLRQFGLAERITHRPAQLSAGERQRVAMARALLNRPKLLLADEPTGNLDPDNAATLLDLLADFHRHGGTVLLVTHDEQAARRAERTIALASGRLVDEVPAGQ